MSGGKDKIITVMKGLAHATAFASPLDKLHLKEDAAQDPRFPLLCEKASVKTEFLVALCEVCDWIGK